MTFLESLKHTAKNVGKVSYISTINLRETLADKTEDLAEVIRPSQEQAAKSHQYQKELDQDTASSKIKDAKLQTVSAK